VTLYDIVGGPLEKFVINRRHDSKLRLGTVIVGAKVNQFVCLTFLDCIGLVKLRGT
jgi:hypothetical protein